MSVTIKDIAKQAGVSYSTVSKALRDSPLVKPPTKKRIIAIAEQLGYKPNVAARNLVSRRSQTIGVVWPTIERVAHSALITSLNQRLEAINYTTLISINDMKTAFSTFNQYPVDAILAFNDSYSPIDYTSSVPIVTYGIAGQHSPFLTIDVNRKKAIQIAVEQLIQLGHQHISYIGDLSGDFLQEEKVKGFKNALELFQLKPFADQTIKVQGLEQYDGYIAARKLLGKKSRPTAIISGSHDLSRGILQAIYENQLSVPVDISLISYDNIPERHHLDIALSTVGVPIDTITKTLVDALMHTIEGKAVPQTIYLEPELNLASSCQALTL
ncbi:putative HTH-type transcriptional repressor ExuR [Pullulanibacillus camelliae]|uniref:Putative HTH-type transcriptional repressor ExuR n=1 Tax=Pullulanibacillus camelliae TaxID=1707096 RepID=A0A8J2VEY6_9BACL|nr:LacI family DNA-binding transcriptional regulator [Pullulanibacillus camelliae]GGE26554.1 putative HTH-type transcriptional repressor ExuR [Pullulanibacillus camelliae]